MTVLVCFVVHCPVPGGVLSLMLKHVKILQKIAIQFQLTDVLLDVVLNSCPII